MSTCTEQTHAVTFKKESVITILSSLSQHPEATAAVTVYGTIPLSSYREFTYRLIRRQGQSQRLYTVKSQCGRSALQSRYQVSAVAKQAQGSWGTCKHHSHDSEGKKAEERRAREREHHLLQEAWMAKGTETWNSLFSPLPSLLTKHTEWITKPENYVMLYVCISSLLL